MGLDSTWAYVVRGLEFAVAALEGLGTLEDLDIDEAVCLDTLVGRDSGEPLVNDGLIVEEAVGLEL